MRFGVDKQKRTFIHIAMFWQNERRWSKQLNTHLIEFFPPQTYSELMKSESCIELDPIVVFRIKNGIE